MKTLEWMNKIRELQAQGKEDSDILKDLIEYGLEEENKTARDEELAKEEARESEIRGES